MKKAIAVIILGLLLTSCTAGIIYGNQRDGKSDNNYRAKSVLLAKDYYKDPEIHFYGYGDTEKSAEMEAEKACMDYVKAMSKDSRLNYEEGCSVEKAKATRRHKKRLSAERSAEREKQAYISKIESKKQECATMGFKPGTEKMAECILRLIEMEGNILSARDIAKKAREQEAWKSVLFGGVLTGTGTPKTSSGTISCIKSGEAVSGINKICYYNCVGSTKTLNVGAANTCPMNAWF